MAYTPDDRTPRNPSELNNTWLIQRLEKPFKSDSDSLLAQMPNVFSFGGGLVNGGLGKEAMDLINQVFRFDYMGASEFEWGAVPSALSRIFNERENYTAFEIEIPLAEVKISFIPKKKGEKKPTPPTGNGTVYVICRAEHRDEIIERIRSYAKDGYGSHLKEATMLERSLLPQDEWDARRCGWLELDNGFFFFTDKGMFDQTAELFGITVGVNL